ncbi:MAG: putative sulfate/molybdate transporter [Methanomicrobiales archaeon]|nr:putative sulfate/molybdate transporter [Methanomicrobiales archaeon]
MDGTGSIKRRYDMYDWNVRYQGAARLSTSLLIVGSVFIFLGLVLAAGILLGRIPLPYAPSTRLLLAIASLVAGLLFGLSLLTLSQVIRLMIVTERNTRYAMNVWMILEERDYAEMAGDLGGEEEVIETEGESETPEKE